MMANQASPRTGGTAGDECMREGAFRRHDRQALAGAEVCVEKTVYRSSRALAPATL
jgi:hypothetical protein